MNSKKNRIRTKRLSKISEDILEGYGDDNIIIVSTLVSGIWTEYSRTDFLSIKDEKICCPIKLDIEIEIDLGRGQFQFDIIKSYYIL